METAPTPATQESNPFMRLASSWDPESPRGARKNIYVSEESQIESDGVDLNQGILCMSGYYVRCHLSRTQFIIPWGCKF